MNKKLLPEHLYRTTQAVYFVKSSYDKPGEGQPTICCATDTKVLVLKTIMDGPVQQYSCLLNGERFFLFIDDYSIDKMFEHIS